MVRQSKIEFLAAATISPLPCTSCMRRCVDVARQAAAAFGCMAAMEVEKWLEIKTPNSISLLKE